MMLQMFDQSGKPEQMVKIPDKAGVWPDVIIDGDRAWLLAFEPVETGFMYRRATVMRINALRYQVFTRVGGIDVHVADADDYRGVRAIFDVIGKEHPGAPRWAKDLGARHGMDGENSGVRGLPGADGAEIAGTQDMPAVLAGTAAAPQSAVDAAAADAGTAGGRSAGPSQCETRDWD